jgi:uncharacterized protein
MIAMELVGVRLEMPANTPIMMLRETEGRRRILPIAIGNPEAAAIHYAMEGIEPPRPLTHDLITSVFGELGVRLERVTVTELRDHTFFAELALTTAAGTHTVSSRPSDAVALAVRVRCAIFASEEVLADAGFEETETEGEDEQIISEFQDFIDSVSPDDFV